jgi:acetyl esterase/lipase
MVITSKSPDPNLARVDPELRAALLSFPELDYEKQFANGRVPVVDGLGSCRDDVSVTEESIAAHAGSPPVTLLVINAPPPTDRLRPAVLFLHGGGFIGGSVRRDVARMQDLAKAHDCVVVSVDYRLAPETPFPGARDDGFAALKWLHTNGAEIGADASRIVLLGESAGGGLAAQLTLQARDHGGLPILAQILSYPMLDDRTGSSQAAPPHIGAFIWTSASNRFGWKSYLAVEPGGDLTPPGAAPAREANLAGLPPAWIGVGGLDLFAGECIDYARRLMAAGVPTGLLVSPGAYHGFNRLVPGARISKSFNASWNTALSHFLGRN